MPAQGELSRRAPGFAHQDQESFHRMLDCKRGNGITDGIYPRYGGLALAQTEQAAADRLGIASDRLLLTGSGMGAFGLVIESADLQTGDAMVTGRQTYSGSEKYVNRVLRARGIKPFSVDSSSIADIEGIIERKQPKVISLETVDNGSEMAVTNVQKLFRSRVVREAKPFIIIDNTFPTNAVVPLSEMMQEAKEDGLRVAGIESGTKSLMCNQDTLGVVYTYDDELLETMRSRRVFMGHTLSTSSREKLLQVMPPSKEQFKKEWDAACSNTFMLAMASADAAGVNDLYTVTYPNLPDHPDTELANRLAPKGIAPVFFVTPTDPEALPPKQIVSAMFESGAMKKVHYAESFGFDKPGVCETAIYVRIAGGQESPKQTKEIGERIQRSLSGLKANGK